jgi:ABC-type multidrug transport system fused ATPase/permease subunit
MREFFQFARNMLAYRGTLLAALAAALLSAAGLGVGLLGLVPVLQNIFGTFTVNGQVQPAKDLPALALALNANIGGIIPQAAIDALPQGRFSALLYSMIALGILTVLGATANFFHSFWSQTIAIRTVTDLRHRAFDHAVRLPAATVTTAGPTTILTNVTGDTGQLASGFIILTSKIVGQLPKGLVALGAAFFHDWRLALGAVALGIVLAAVIRKLGTKIRRAGRKGLDAGADLYRTTSEAIANLRVVKTNNAEQRSAQAFQRVVDEVVRQELRVRSARSLSSPLVEALTFVGLGVMVVIVGKAIIDQALDPSEFIGTMVALGIASASLRPLTGVYNDLQLAAAAAVRLRAFFALPQEPGRGPALPALPRHTTDIAFNSVTFTYPGAPAPAINNLSLTIKHGQTVAFVGPNGCGKTTLLSLLTRLHNPAAGTITIDGTDIATVNVDSLRQQFGVVTQDVVLFKGTIRWNLAYGVPRATPEQIVAAAKQARADEFIVTKPGAYDANLGEIGSGLSGGQRQRLAIARAILRDPAILILDEATSMIDADSERKIADALAEFSKGRTCLVVAHRLSTVVHADLIVVMNAGAIEATGTHQELLQTSETYRLIAANQLIRQQPANATTQSA